MTKQFKVLKTRRDGFLDEWLTQMSNQQRWRSPIKDIPRSIHAKQCLSYHGVCMVVIKVSKDMVDCLSVCKPWVLLCSSNICNYWNSQANTSRYLQKMSNLFPIGDLNFYPVPCYFGILPFSPQKWQFSSQREQEQAKEKLFSMSSHVICVCLSSPKTKQFLLLAPQVLLEKVQSESQRTKHPTSYMHL